MSIPGAVAELNKEIERLTQIRDSLLQGPSIQSAPATPVVREKRKYTRTAPAPVKTVAPAKKIASKKAAPATAAPKKRAMSAATKKKISDAAKARAASKSAK